MLSKRVTRSPVAVQLHLTRRCNLDCLYCGAEEFIRNEKQVELTKKEWVIILKRLKEIQVFNISFTGGEIFLRQDIFDILEAAVKYNFPKKRLTTNGTLISDAIAKQLRNISFVNIEVSLDGNRKHNDQIRGIGSFEKTMKGINNLVNNGIIPIIRFTPLQINYRYLKEIVDILYPLGIKKLVFNTLKSTGKSKEIYKEIMLNAFEDASEFQKIIDNIKKAYRDFKISSLPIFYQDFPKNYQESMNRPTSNKPRLTRISHKQF